MQLERLWLRPEPVIDTLETANGRVYFLEVWLPLFPTRHPASAVAALSARSAPPPRQPPPAIGVNRSTTSVCQLCGARVAFEAAWLDRAHLRCMAYVKPEVLAAALASHLEPVEDRPLLERVMAMPPEERAWELIEGRGEGVVTMGPCATDEELAEQEILLESELPSQLRAFYRRLGGLSVEGEEGFHFCSLAEADLRGDEFQSDWDSYTDAWNNSYYPERYLVFQQYARESGDGIIWDAELDDFVEVHHKEGITRRGLDPFEVLLRTLLTPWEEAPGEAFAELERALVLGADPWGTIERHYDHLMSLPTRPLDPALAIRVIDAYRQDPGHAVTLLRPWLPDLKLGAEQLTVIAAGAVLNDNEALAEWALREAGGRLPGIHRLIELTGKRTATKYEAFLARCG